MTIVLADDGAVLNETDTMSRYREWPAPDAANVVRCWWEQRIGSGAEDYLQRVLPDGCSDVIVTAAGDALIAGPTMAAALPRLAPGARLRGLRIRTGALAAVLGLPGTELRDLTVPLNAYLKEAFAAPNTYPAWPLPARNAPSAWAIGRVSWPRRAQHWPSKGADRA